MLAAGNSVRFGVENKLLALVNGKMLIDYALELHGDIFYEEKILVTQAGFAKIHSRAKKWGFEIVVNPQPERGIGSSVSCAVGALHKRVDGVLFAVCDQPYLKAETVLRLIDAFYAEPNCIIALGDETRRGNPVIFPQRCFADLSGLNGDVGGSAVIRMYPALLRLSPVSDPMELLDIDTKMTK